MATDIDIFNMALDALGQTVTIGSMAEQSKPGRLAVRHYAQTRDELLASHPWPFARKAIALELTNDTPLLGWANQYAYPADCMRAWRVCDRDGMRATYRAWLSCRDPALFNTQMPAIPFEVVAGGQQNCIVTDLDGAYLFYTARVDESRFTPLFTRALVCLISSRIAMPMTVTPALKEQAERDSLIAQLAAASEGFNESVPDPDETTPSLACRN